MTLGAWTNTGGNGQASAVWVRRVGRFEVVIHVMRYRCMLDTWIGASIADEGFPFESLDAAKAYGDRWLAESAARAPQIGQA